MAWLSVDENGQEVIFKEKPIRVLEYGLWVYEGKFEDSSCVDFPKGSIKKLIGRELTWNDEPVELKEENNA